MKLLTLIPLAGAMTLAAACAHKPDYAQALAQSLAAEQTATVETFANAEAVDHLRDAGDLEAARTMALRLAEHEPDNPEALWRAARSLADLTLSAPDEAARSGAALRGLEYARQAAALAPESADAQSELAFLLGMTTHLQPMMQRSDHARATIEAAEHALALRSDDALAHETLGIVNLRLATLPWIARLMARDAPEGTLEESIAQLQQAAQDAPSTEMHYQLAKALITSGQEHEAMVELRRGLALPAAGARDAIFRPRCEELLESLQ